MNRGCLGLGLLLSSALLACSAFAQPPPDFDAYYGVEKAGLTMGRATLRFRQPVPGYYDYRLRTTAVGVARLMVSSEVIERSRGKIVDTGFQPTTYHYERRGDDKARRAELRFDWQALEVLNDVAAYPWRMDITPDTIDRVISPLQLMHDLANRDPGQARLTYRIADGGRLKTYLLTIEGEQTIETPAGRFRALHIRRRDTDSDRETHLWCAPELDYLAVQVEQWEDGGLNFRLALTGVEGMDITTAEAK